MNNIALVKKSTYFESVTLMGLSKRLSLLPGVLKVSLSMGTELNQSLLKQSGMNSEETDAATPNDLMIALVLEEGVDSRELLEQVERALTRKNNADAGEQVPARSIRGAIDRLQDANLAIISVPGEYAAFEAKRALDNNLHVMLFSDNVSIEDEIKLKKIAHEKGLLMMGPDCGTAIINQKPLCFANAVQPGSVGIVGASGTGMQEVISLLDAAGEGISQAIGTGGRDLSNAVGGIMSLDALDSLSKDEQTEIIVFVAKAPEVGVIQKIESVVSSYTKPVVLCFLSDKIQPKKKGSVYYVNSLEQAALSVLQIRSGKGNLMDTEDFGTDKVALNPPQLNKSQKYVRGVFCGGTLTNEARMIFKQINPNAPVFCNVSHCEQEALDDWMKSAGNVFLDMGDDIFTVGKAHPMIDPELRNQRIYQEALDPEVAVVLFDVVLGYGAHPDPVQSVLVSINEAKEELSKQGRDICFVGYVLGTDLDPQNRSFCVEKLRQAGVIVANTNAQAARIASALIKEVK